jgi:hypothetical protein
MQSRGYNSSINGQLALKYRFATALQCWSDHEDSIVEPQGIYYAYRTLLNDDPQRGPGRRLFKVENVDLFRRLGLAGLAEENVSYVALTWDRADKAFFRNPGVTSDYLPRFYDHDGQDRYNDMADRIGWIGYSELERTLNLSKSEEYVAARNLMLPASEPTDADYESQRPSRLEGYADEIKALTVRIIAMLASDRIESQNGSYSYKDEDNRTVAKIILLRDRVFVGVRVCAAPGTREYENPAEWGIGLTLATKWAGVGARRARFDGVYVRSESDLGSAYELLEAFNHRFPPALQVTEENEPDITSD